MKDESTVSGDPRQASRRGLLVGGLGVGIAAVAGAVAGALPRTGRDGHQHPAGEAHGGAIHTQKHGGDTHMHENLSHTHAVMVHALDPQTIKYVDTTGSTGQLP